MGQLIVAHTSKMAHITSMLDLPSGRNLCIRELAL